MRRGADVPEVARTHGLADGRAVAVVVEDLVGVLVPGDVGQDIRVPAIEILQGLDGTRAGRLPGLGMTR
jgi:hypothetical protein